MSLFIKVQNIEENIIDKIYFQISEILLYGGSLSNNAKGTGILNSTIKSIFDVFSKNLWKLQKLE